MSEEQIISEIKSAIGPIKDWESIENGILMVYPERPDLKNCCQTILRECNSVADCEVFNGGLDIRFAPPATAEDILEAIAEQWPT